MQGGCGKMVDEITCSLECIILKMKKYMGMVE